MNTNSGKLAALAMVLDYAGLNFEDVQVDRLNLIGDLQGICYEIEFTTVCLRYYAYVDVIEGEVVGFLTVPNERGVAITTNETAA